MRRKFVLISLGIVSLFLFPIHISAAESKEALEGHKGLENALSYQQQLFDNARSRGVIVAGHPETLTEFRHAVEKVRQIPKDKLSPKDLEPAGKTLARLEIEFVTPESLAILQQEKKEEAKSLLLLPPAERSNWKPGVSTLSFGRFGWRATDGLLCDSVAFESIKTTDKDVELGRVPSADRQISTLGCDVSFQETSITLAVAPPGVKNIQAKVKSVNWIGKVLALSSAEQKDLGTVATTLQRPATRFDYTAPGVMFKIGGATPEKSTVGYMSPTGWKSFPLTQKGKHLLSAEMKYPWALLELADAKRPQKILIAIQLQKRVKQLEISPEGLALTAQSGALGNFWVFRPWGILRKGNNVNVEISESLVQKINDLCRLNLAWPVRCEEFYRVDSARQEVHIYNSTITDNLTDDWSTRPLEATAIPPMVMLAQRYGVPVTIQGKVRNWDLPTRYGDFATVEGKGLRYAIPIPPLNRHGLFADTGKKEFTKKINQWVYQQGKIDGIAVDWAYIGVAQALAASPYLNTDSQKILATQKEVVKTNLRPEHYWKLYKWRMEPFSARRYCYDYPCTWYDPEPTCDMNWGNTLVFYGLDQWAAFGGMWKEVEAAWPRIWPLTEYLVKSHDWAWMADSITEDGLGAAIDCLTADYAGLVGITRLARTLGKNDEADRALYLTAKTALCHTLRFAYLEYVQKYDMWHTDSPGMGIVNGFHEHDCFIHSKHEKVGWWGTCSLGYGINPECFDATFAYIGKPAMMKWWDVANTIFPKWYDGNIWVPQKGTAYNGNSGFVVLDNIYLQFRLGTPDKQLAAWQTTHEQTKHTDGYWGLPVVVAEIASRDCPVQIATWGRCDIEKTEYLPEKKQAQARLVNNTGKNQEIFFSCRTLPAKISLDEQSQIPQTTKDRWGTSLIRLNLTPGTHVVEFKF
jgi:hypothetical protein